MNWTERVKQIIGQLIRPLATDYTLQAPMGSATNPAYSFKDYPNAGAYQALGSGGLAFPSIMHLKAADATAGETDIQGGRLDIDGGRGTGAANTGGLGANSLIRIRVAPRGGSGTSLNALSTIASFYDRQWTVGGDLTTQYNSNGVGPLTSYIHGVAAAGTNIGGGDLQVNSGTGTGNAAASSITFQTPTVGASGTTAQTLATRSTVDSVGVVMASASWFREPAGRKVTAAQFDKTNATLATVTGLSVTLVAGRAYRFRAMLFVDADGTGGHKYAIAGTSTATYILYQIDSIENGANAFVINSRETALGGEAEQVGATAVLTTIEGVIVVNAAGTLTVEFAQQTSSGTSSVLRGSYFIVEDMGS